jgi:hypothetical protein
MVSMSNGEESLPNRNRNRGFIIDGVLDGGNVRLGDGLGAWEPLARLILIKISQ